MDAVSAAWAEIIAADVATMQQMRQKIDQLSADLARVEAERDTLRAACEKIVAVEFGHIDDAEVVLNCRWPWWSDVMSELNAALAGQPVVDAEKAALRAACEKAHRALCMRCPTWSDCGDYDTGRCPCTDEVRS
jgi:hypothetical protein